jgi:L-ascorbate metabolism protein UlaG (beta-lactamase superfamily)
MATTLTWFGHGSFGLQIGDHKVIVDPFFTHNPLSSTSGADLEADFILLSHGHGDHAGDLEALANRTGALVITNNDLAVYYAAKGVKTHGQHIGGGYNHPFGYLKLTQALHGSGTDDGFHGGTPCGFLITADNGKKIYLACDTGLFGDMELIGDEGIEFAALPIGDNFTMGPDDALRAAKLLRPKRVVPVHYNTWDVIAQDPDAWVKRVRQETKADAFVMKPGESVKI